MDDSFEVTEVDYIKITDEGKTINQEPKATVFCNDLDAFTQFVLNERGCFSTEDVLFKLCLDGGGGFFKLCLSICQKPENPNKGTRALYTQGIAARSLKDTGVKKIFIIGIAPEVQENYTNVLKMWILVQLVGGLTESVMADKFTITTDLKLANIILGLMSHSSNHPCSWCDVSKAKLHTKGEPRTLESLTSAFWNWYQVGNGDIKQAKNFGNVVHLPILKGNPNDRVIDVLPPPELHLLLGPFNTIFKAIYMDWPGAITCWARKCHVERKALHGG